jgi:hypothetical protein
MFEFSASHKQNWISIKGLGCVHFMVPQMQTHFGGALIAGECRATQELFTRCWAFSLEKLVTDFPTLQTHCAVVCRLTRELRGQSLRPSPWLE